MPVVLTPLPFLCCPRTKGRRVPSDPWVQPDRLWTVLLPDSPLGREGINPPLRLLLPLLLFLLASPPTEATFLRPSLWRVRAAEAREEGLALWSEEGSGEEANVLALQGFRVPSLHRLVDQHKDSGVRNSFPSVNPC